MASFLKKALSVFVEIDEDTKGDTNITTQISQQSPEKPAKTVVALNQDDVEKFGKHFDDLLSASNLPGPDYYEFCKMSETLEAAVPDEKTRFSAVFASLSIQGLTKDKLISSAKTYVSVVEQDKAKFEQAVNEKTKVEIDGKKSEAQELAKKIAQNSEAIKKLTQEIADAQSRIQTIDLLIKSQTEKIQANSEGYNYACNAVLNQINVDINKIQSFL